MFLHKPEVPPTNNHAEQMLRPAVINRKVGGCNINLLGALVHSILASRSDELTLTGYSRRVQEIENRLDDWLAANLRRPTLSAELNRLDDHVRAHRGEWLVFLHDAGVPPTNNHAERMLRPAVITRKVGGCNKILWGALVHGVLASLMVTCHRQGKRFLDLARRLWQSSDPQAIDLEARPGG